MKTDEEWMVYVLQQDVSLRHDMFRFVAFDYHFLLQHLDCINFGLCFVLGKKDFTETALTDDLQKFKIARFCTEINKVNA